MLSLLREIFLNEKTIGLTTKRPTGIGAVYGNVQCHRFQWRLNFKKAVMGHSIDELGILILAGGKSSRMGRDKALLEYGKKSFLECIVQQCSAWGGEIVISVAAEETQIYQQRFSHDRTFDDVRWVEDRVANMGPLVGIEAGLKTLEPMCQWAFVTGCDVPILQKALVKSLYQTALDEQVDAVTPIQGQRIFGMTAVYRTRCWREASALIEKRQLRVSLLADRLNTQRVQLRQLRQYDPNLDSFVNINSLDDYYQFLLSQGLESPYDVSKKPPQS